MQQYTVTSVHIEGQIYILYKENGTLCKVDMTSATMNVDEARIFLDKVPVSEIDISKAFSKSVTIVQSDFQISFLDFWNAYQKKINKLRCEPLWKKLSHSNQVRAFYGIRAYDKYLKKHNRIKCDPENYLKNEMWESEWK